MNESISYSQEKNLSGRTALITGATGHIGVVFAKALAQFGVNLILLDRDEKSLIDLAETLSLYDIHNVIGHLDLNDVASLHLVKDKVIEIHKKQNLPATSPVKLDILINNAGFVGASDDAGWNAPFKDQSLTSWQKAMNINLTAPFCLIQHCLEFLSKSDQASIINIGSIYASAAPRHRLYEGANMHLPAAYSASKAGLIQFTKYLASDLAPNIRVNAISPGGVERGQQESFMNAYVKETPLARMAQEKDFVGAMLFLASQQSAYMTGQELIIDGGFTL